MTKIELVRYVPLILGNWLGGFAPVTCSLGSLGSNIIFVKRNKEIRNKELLWLKISNKSLKTICVCFIETETKTSHFGLKNSD